MSHVSDQLIISCLTEQGIKDYSLAPPDDKENDISIYGWKYEKKFMPLDDIIKSIRTLENNYVKLTMPTYICPWISGSGPAITILENEDDGTFFVRQSTKKDDFVLSIVEQWDVIHYPIEGTDGRYNEDYTVDQDQLLIIIDYVENLSRIKKIKGLSLPKPKTNA